MGSESTLFFDQMVENLIDSASDIADVGFLVIDLGGHLDSFHGGSNGDWDGCERNSFEDHFGVLRLVLRAVSAASSLRLISSWIASTERVFSGVLPYSTEIERGSW